ncbi:MAG: IS1380 family transposase [Candidatus Brocadiaceae bacterium]|nr:IS1380 family transposase [Candidatus Brocadiaceae bacterium]MCP4988335.1 IS1380 family transposase [Colwellia sp.]
MISYKILQSSQQINDLGGLSVVAQILKGNSIFGYSPIAEKRAVRRDRITDSDILISYLTILCQGRTAFTDVERFRKSKFIRRTMDIKKVPSEEILRQRLDDLSVVEGILPELLKFNEEILQKCTFATTKLPSGEKCIVLDIDVSPFDNSRTKKERVSCTYKMHDGFAPAFAYLGEEGYMINSELRPGKQHCQNGMLVFLHDSIAAAKRVLPNGTKILVRLDSGNDAVENLIELLNGEDLFFLIKRNIRKENKQQWFERAKGLGEQVYNNGYSSRYHAKISHITPTNHEDMAVDVVVQATEELEDRNGQRYIVPKYKIETYWTNLYENSNEVIELYHQHGTSEQFHSELKSDMGVERLPSSSFKTNSLVLVLANIAYNLLRKIGIDMVPIDGGQHQKNPIKRRRIKTVLQNIIYTACKWVKTKGKNLLYWGCDSPNWWIIKKLYKQYV